MTTMHDVIRALIRGGHAFHDEANQRRALLAVDAHERGFVSAESYQEELDAQAATAAHQANPDAPETDAQRALRLQAENTRLEALLRAQASPTAITPVEATPTT